MASIAEIKKQRAANGGGGSSWGDSIGSVAFEVESYDKDKFEFTGKIVHSSALEAGESVVVKSMDNMKEKNADNMKRGMGTGAGSVLMLEGAFLNDKKELTVRWMTTAISAAKKLDSSAGHDTRSVERVMVEVPRLNFRNPVQSDAEPAYINWQLNAQNAVIYTKGGDRKEYDRDWLRAKLKEANDAKTYVRVSALSPDPSSALKVNGYQEALNEIESIISEPASVAMIRINDGTNTEVRRIYSETRLVGDQYVIDPAGVVERLNEKGLFGNLISNEDLDQNISEGWTLEVIPAKQIVFIGDTNKFIVEDIIANDLSDLNNYTARFGQEEGFTSDVIAIINPTKSGEPSFVGLPIAVSKDRVHSNFIKTKNFDLDYSQAQQDEPANEAVDHQDNGNEMGEDEYFNGADFEMKPLSQVQDADESPATRQAPRY